MKVLLHILLRFLVLCLRLALLDVMLTLCLFQLMLDHADSISSGWDFLIVRAVNVGPAR